MNIVLQSTMLLKMSDLPHKTDFHPFGVPVSVIGFLDYEIASYTIATHMPPLHQLMKARLSKEI